MTFEAAQKVADAVLYEGYLLYPYRASSDKNRVRFQFGVVAPRNYSIADESETWEMQTECLVEAFDDTWFDVRVRFLQLQARTVEAVDPTAPGGFSRVASLEVAGEPLQSWDEAIEGQLDAENLSLPDLTREERVIEFQVPGGQEVEPVAIDGVATGRIVRTRWPILVRVRVAVERDGTFHRIRARIENVTTATAPIARRDEALRSSLLGCHTLLAVRGGAFVSLIDPPPTAREASSACTNLKTWPVLVADPGNRDLVLSSPIILYDYPAIATESQGDLFDSTEIDEILTLRIMTLSDDEKRAARATDPRARAIIDAAEEMPPEILDRLHGAIRYLRETSSHEVVVRDDEDPAAAIRPWAPDLREPEWPVFTTSSVGLSNEESPDLPPSVWVPDARVPPDRAAVEISGIAISRGASVRLRPNRRADSMDLFLTDRLATVEAVYESVDGDMHVAVTLDDDPAQDLQRASGRYFYFAPDELEPLAPAAQGAGPAPVILERTLASEARQ
jgi:hypothetical protein